MAIPMMLCGWSSSERLKSSAFSTTSERTESRWDLKPHEFLNSRGPQPSASASSATRTGYRREYRAGLSASQQRVGVGSNRRMGYNASEQMFRYCVRWLWGYQRDRKRSFLQ